jgi:hypothetical protein
MHKEEMKEKSILLSKATSSAANELLVMLGLPEIGASWPNIPSNLEDFPGFDWLSQDEDSEGNRKAYMAHLESHVKLPENYSMADVQPKKSLLTVKIPIRGTEESRHIHGTTDVVIAKSNNIENDAIRNSVEALLELKTPTNMKRRDHTLQMVCERFAASFLNHKHEVVSALTDPNSSWIFWWYAENPDGSGVALYKLNLQGEKAARLAKYILESLTDRSRRGTLPDTFVDRLSFESLMEILAKDDSNKRVRRDFGGGGGSSQAPGGEPTRPGGQPPAPSGSGGNSSSGVEFRNNVDAGDGSRTIDMARTLSLFAPHSNSDVANELDLLDMVDEDEQYEIVRSFAAKYIVPYMRGET